MRKASPHALGETIRQLRDQAQPATLLAAVQASWRTAVGDHIAEQAWPVRDRDGVITVECRAATWAQELDLLQDELVERVNSQLGEARVSRLRMIVGDGNPPASI
jgi:predicted nucleic acid-binding Zn ribbon protein